MNEYIEISFRRNGKPFPLRRQTPGGVEFEEADPLERTVGISLNAGSDATRERMNSIRRIQGWEPGQFKVKVSVEGGTLVLRGVNEHALPEGLYKVMVEIEEARTPPRLVTADVKHDGFAAVTIDVQLDERDVAIDLVGCDQEIRDLLDRSVVDTVSGTAWLGDQTRRPTRQACLLNLMASMRTRPTAKAPLIRLVRNVFYVGNDRLYARVDRSFSRVLQDLSKDPRQPFYDEDEPHSDIHLRLRDAIPPGEATAGFGKLHSFRSEGKPSMQVVVVEPAPDLSHTYAEFDIDLGNPLQDVLGFFVHMGELLDGKPTNHLDMRKVLAKTKASEFLYYTIVAA